MCDHKNHQHPIVLRYFHIFYLKPQYIQIYSRKLSENDKRHAKFCKQCILVNMIWMLLFPKTFIWLSGELWGKIRTKSTFTKKLSDIWEKGLQLWWISYWRTSGILVLSTFPKFMKINLLQERKKVDERWREEGKRTYSLPDRTFIITRDKNRVWCCIFVYDQIAFCNSLSLPVTKFMFKQYLHRSHFILLYHGLDLDIPRTQSKGKRLRS